MINTEILAPEGTLEIKLQLAARAIFQTLAEVPSDAPLVLALCGGRSVVGLLTAMRSESANQPKDLLKRLHFFMVDERIVPIADPDSNFGGLKKQLFDQLISEGFVSEEQLHPLMISRESAVNDCEKYLSELEKLGGIFSVVVLGMGEDGHIAGLFPRHPALSINKKAFIDFYDSPKLPPARVTASVPLIRGAKLSILLALGEAKREAWNRFQSSEVSVADCPAKLAVEAGRCLVVTDLVG